MDESMTRREVRTCERMRLYGLVSCLHLPGGRRPDRVTVMYK